MEKRVTKNIGDLLILSSKNFFHNFGRIMLGTIVFLLPFFICAAMCFVFQAVWAYVTFVMIAAVLFGPMQVGYNRYCTRVYAGETPCVLVIFKAFNIKTVAFLSLFGFVLILLYVLGLILLILPVLVVIAFFSMTTFYIAKYDCQLDAFKMCFSRMRRNRITMMSYKSIFYLLFFMLFVLGGLAAFGVYALYAYSAAAAIVSGALAGLILLFVLCALVAYYHTTNEMQFEEIEIYYERKQKRLAAKNGVVEETPAQEVKTEEPAQEEVKEVKKTTRTRKTTTTK